MLSISNNRIATRSSSVHRPHAFTLVELLVVIAIIGVLVALLLPAVQAAREAARRAECSNKLKQIALAMHLYHDSRETFPPGAQKDKVGTAGFYFSGWTREIMPYIENSQLRELYQPALTGRGSPLEVSDQFDADVKQFREANIDSYNCPSDAEPALLIPDSGPHNSQEFRTSSYVANAGRGDGRTTWYLYEDVPLRDAPPKSDTGLDWGWRGPLHAEIAPEFVQPTTNNRLTRESIRNITDGTTQTLLVAESTNIFENRRPFWAWTWGNYIMGQTIADDRAFDDNYPDCPNIEIPAYTKAGSRACMSAFTAFHNGGMNAAMCDASVSFISFDIDLFAYAAMGSIDAADNEYWKPPETPSRF